MFLRFLFYFFLFYLLYKLLFDFIIPVFKTTWKVRRGFQQMKDQMNRNNAFPNQPKYTEPTEMKVKVDKDDYIEFEEVK